MTTTTTTTPTTTTTRLADLHLHRLQLFAYCSIGQTLLQRALIKQTLECGLSKNPDPYIALSEILNLNKEQLKKLKNNLTVNNSSKRLIYKDCDLDELNPSINIYKLDTCSTIELLNGIDVFKISPKHFQAGIQCLFGQNREESCCGGCSSTEKCTKPECKVNNKCCELKNSRKFEECYAYLKCGTNEFTCCNKNNKVNCASCTLCLHCYLRFQNKPTVLELIRTGDWLRIPYCQTRKIKISIYFMSIIRNLTMRSTNEECAKLDASKFQSCDLPGINNWCDLNTIIAKFFKNVNELSGFPLDDRERMRKDIDKIGKMADKEQLLKLYKNKIRTFGVSEHLFDSLEQQQPKKSIQQLQRLAFHVQFYFLENTSYDLDCELAIKIRHYMASKIKIVFYERYLLIDNGLLPTTETSTAMEIRLKFQIEAIDTPPKSNDFLTVHEKSNSKDSNELWRNIYNCIIKDGLIPNLRGVERVFWQLGSLLVISVVLYKHQQGVCWTNEEFEMIDKKCLPSICSKLNEQYSDCLVFSCDVIPIEEIVDELKTLSFEIVSNEEEVEDDIEDVVLAEILKDDFSYLFNFFNFHDCDWHHYIRKFYFYFFIFFVFLSCVK